MKGIDGVLEEELGRLLELEKSYLREIKALPKGSIQQKKIKKKTYPYLVCRDGSDVVYGYVGKLSKSEIEKLKAGIEQRRKFESLLREVRKNIAHLKKIVYGRKRAA